MAKYELHRTSGSGERRKVAESKSAEALRAREQKLRQLDAKGSSTSYSVRKNS